MASAHLRGHRERYRPNRQGKQDIDKGCARSEIHRSRGPRSSSVLRQLISIAQKIPEEAEMIKFRRSPGSTPRKMSLAVHVPNSGQLGTSLTSSVNSTRKSREPGAGASECAMLSIPAHEVAGRFYGGRGKFKDATGPPGDRCGVFRSSS